MSCLVAGSVREETLDGTAEDDPDWSFLDNADDDAVNRSSVDDAEYKFDRTTKVN